MVPAHGASRHTVPDACYQQVSDLLERIVTAGCWLQCTNGVWGSDALLDVGSDALVDVGDVLVGVALHAH
jgi:hypothetical protein